jgi:putative Ca2+/H+ antiporter (TMEM165/GDT1 family)
MDLGVLAVVFGAIFVVELPDKTFIATLVLATRFKPIYVWIGVGLAFTVQTLVAVAVGHAATFLPKDAIHILALVMFLIGAALLFREGRSHHIDSGEEYVEKAGNARGPWRSILASFLVLFAAEWGDLSQLLTITFVARYDDPVSVFVGALGALLVVSALACLLGRALLRYVALHLLHYVGAGVCLLMAGLTAYDLWA